MASRHTVCGGEQHGKQPSSGQHTNAGVLAGGELRQELLRHQFAINLSGAFDCEAVCGEQHADTGTQQERGQAVGSDKPTDAGVRGRTLVHEELCSEQPAHTGIQQSDELPRQPSSDQCSGGGVLAGSGVSAELCGDGAANNDDGKELAAFVLSDDAASCGSKPRTGFIIRGDNPACCSVHAVSELSESVCSEQSPCGELPAEYRQAVRPTVAAFDCALPQYRQAVRRDQPAGGEQHRESSGSTQFRSVESTHVGVQRTAERGKSHDGENIHAAIRNLHSQSRGLDAG